MKQVGKRPSEGMRATVKLLGCTALFTAVYSADRHPCRSAARRRSPV